jgi:cytochrome c oxidase subunit IV
MKPRHRSDLLTWVALLLAATVEFGVSFLAVPSGVRPILILPSVGMAILVALGFMRLLAAPDIAKSFAIAGIFWLTVLLGLVMTDPLTRAVYAVIG